jgi:hypothetical protein
LLSLGPIPEAVRRAVQRLIAEDRAACPEGGEWRYGVFLTGGPTGCSYLDAEGEVWNHCFWDESVERVADGPLKVGLVAIASSRVSELAAWLPARPAEATDCEPCHGNGWLPPPLDRLQCPECFGMGWVAPLDNA